MGLTLFVLNHIACESLDTTMPARARRDPARGLRAGAA
ncbi:hypothetical protein C7S17_7184 [Burkholderia thailandensis]|nr:hypothetical protein [Burkholderia thailandensis]